MKVNTKIQYSIVLLNEISKSEKPTRLQDVSKNQKLSLHYLEQISRKLRQANLIKSVRGPGGGYILASDIVNITLFDVYTALDEDTSFSYDIQDNSSEKKFTLNILDEFQLVMQEKLRKTIVYQQS